MDQTWFEMTAHRRRSLRNSVWIPLRSSEYLTREGERGFAGYKTEFFGAGSLAVPINDRDRATKLGWGDIGIAHDQTSYAWEAGYKPADVYQEADGVDLGIELVLVQSINAAHAREWNLNQDVVFALGLIREDDRWLRADEGYVEVARIRRGADERPAVLEIKSEFLREYLAARQMALRIVTYRSREAVLQSVEHIAWRDGTVSESTETDRYEGRVQSINEGGELGGRKIAVFHVKRTDVDYDADVPEFGPLDGTNTESTSWVKDIPVDHPIFRVEGEVWRNEWIEPAEHSTRIRRDEVPSRLHYAIEASGRRVAGDELNDEDIMKWLWFRPEVMMSLSHRRGGSLSWFTRETGEVSCSPDYKVSFGVNDLGLVNVYAYDVVKLPEWQQQLWHGYNVTPEGGVSAELMSAQAEGKAASTNAPEAYLKDSFDLLNEIFRRMRGVELLAKHDAEKDILSRCHRFRAAEQDGILGLAKDLNRLFAERLNTAELKTLVPLKKGEKFGSLKVLENCIRSVSSADDAGHVMAPFFGINELRQADAHLPRSELIHSLDKCGVDSATPPVSQGSQMIHTMVLSMREIARVFLEASPDKFPNG
jgi:hypothetical protein